jgi:hypothetical protein
VNAFAGRTIQRLGHAAERNQRGLDRRRPVLPQRRVERLAGDVFLREVGDPSFSARRQRGGDTGVARLLVDERFERGGQLVGLLAGEIESKQLQRDEPAVARVVRAKYGT